MTKEIPTEEESSVKILPASPGGNQAGGSPKQLTVLVIEDNVADYAMIRDHLCDEPATVSFQTLHAVRLSDGLRRLDEGEVHIVLLDLNLPDSSGIETFRKAKAHAPRVPMIILTGLDDESIAIQAALEGAQDYLVKGNLNSDSLIRCLRYALARHRTREKLGRALRRAEASEQRFRCVTETANDAIILADGGGNIICWNQGARTIFGYEEGEVLGKPLTVLMPERHREAHQRGFERHCRTGQSRIMGKLVELTGLRKDGSQFPLELTISTWSAAEGRFYSGIIRDVTERKRAEQERIQHLQTEQDLIKLNLEMRIAWQVQQRLFPERRPSLPGFDIDGAVYPAETVSGDLFDFIPLSDGAVGVVVADVSGHGLGPALLMAQIQANLRAFAHTHEDPGEVLRQTNRRLALAGSGRFVTVLLARVDARARSFLFSSAGHKGYLLRAGSDVETLGSTSTALGVMQDLPIASSPLIALEPGDLVLLPTDGIEEAMAPDKTLFGRTRTLEVTNANRQRSAHEIVHALYQVARDFTQGAPQQDDMTAVVIKVTA